MAIFSLGYLYFGVVPLFLVYSSIFLIIFRELKNDLFSPLLILFSILFLYFFIKSVGVELGVLEYFWAFRLGSASKVWVFVLVIFFFFFYYGYKISTRGNYIEKIGNGSEFLCWCAMGLFLVGFIAFGYYLFLLGGLAGIVDSYSVDMFLERVVDDRMTIVVNLVNWCFLAGLVIFIPNFEFSKIATPFRRLVVVSFVVLILLAAISFTRRGQVLLYLLIFLAAFYFHKDSFSLRTIFAPSIASFILLYGMYVFRSFSYGDSVIEALFSGFNSGEFWVFDQFLNVVNLVGVGISYDFGYLHIKSLFFLFFPYSEYETVGQMLIHSSTGIDRWGVPPSVVGYSFMVGGWVGLPFYSFLVGAIVGFIERTLKSRFNTSPFFVSLYLIFICYLWYFFRSGDPMLATYYVNRWAMVVIFMYLISGLIDRRRLRR